MSRARARFTQADVVRALKAAVKAGCDVAVDILPDGTIRLSRAVKDEAQPPPDERRLVF